MSNQMNSHRAANGQGNIRQRTKTGKNGVEYTYWEGRVTISLKDGRTEKHYVSGKTQHEALEKMQKARVEATEGSYVEPNRITVSQWLDTWLQTYLNDVKPRTVEAYELNVRRHIKPALGDIQLSTIRPIRFITTSKKPPRPSESPKLASMTCDIPMRWRHWQMGMI